jgi:hypothetical protein
MNTHARLITPRRTFKPRRTATTAPPPLDLEPATAYEAITRQKVESLEGDLSEIKSRVDTIFYLIIGSILADMLARWIGA